MAIRYHGPAISQNHLAQLTSDWTTNRDKNTDRAPELFSCGHPCISREEEVEDSVGGIVHTDSSLKVALLS